MMARILTISAVALVTSGSQVSCNTGDGTAFYRDDPQPAGVSAAFTTLLVLKDDAGNEKYAFQRGELITFEVTVRNRTTQSAVLDYTGYTGTVQIFNNGGSTSLWDPYRGQVFAQVVQSRPFPAGDEQVFQFTWNQVLPDGSNLPAGAYEAQGLLNGMAFLGAGRTPVDDRDLESTLRRFTIN